MQNGTCIIPSLESPKEILHNSIPRVTQGKLLHFMQMILQNHWLAHTPWPCMHTMFSIYRKVIRHKSKRTPLCMGLRTGLRTQAERRTFHGRTQDHREVPATQRISNWIQQSWQSQSLLQVSKQFQPGRGHTYFTTGGMFRTRASHGGYVCRQKMRIKRRVLKSCHSGVEGYSVNQVEHA